ncbi:MAG: hypothetical protein JRG82_19060, partial [Deltaproteobacteria bacterium]|nr:hypothetical protein [Deltaproteobacteria bacterium]
IERNTDDPAELRAHIGYQHFPKAALQGDVEQGLVVAGQIVGMVQDLPGVGELMERMVEEAASTLDARTQLAR